MATIQKLTLGEEIECDHAADMDGGQYCRCCTGRGRFVPACDLCGAPATAVVDGLPFCRELCPEAERCIPRETPPVAYDPALALTEELPAFESMQQVVARGLR